MCFNHSQVNFNEHLQKPSAIQSSLIYYGTAHIQVYNSYYFIAYVFNFIQGTIVKSLMCHTKVKELAITYKSIFSIMYIRI